MTNCKQNVVDKLSDVINILCRIGQDAEEDEQYVELATEKIAECITELEK